MSTTYRLRVTNNSSAFEKFAVYQNDPDLGVYNLLSLAWFVKGAHPGQNLFFEWTTDYSVMWSESGITGTAGNAVKFTVGQEVPVDPSDTDRNGVELSYLDGVPLLQPAKLAIGTSQPGSVYVNELSTLPDAGAGLVGLAVSGRPAYAAPAMRNRLEMFTPHANYWIAAGNFEAGVAIDAEEISAHAQNVEYVNGVYDMTVDFNRGREWSVSETPII
jgi:hypothetical protein